MKGWGLENGAPFLVARSVDTICAAYPLATVQPLAGCLGHLHHYYLQSVIKANKWIKLCKAVYGLLGISP